MKIGNTEYEIRVWLCTNDEVLTRSTDLNRDRDLSDEADMLIQAMSAACDHNYTAASNFRDWNGGRFCQFGEWQRQGGVCAIRVAACEIDEDGDAIDGFEEIKRSEWPAEVTAEVDRLVGCISEAFDKEASRLVAEQEADDAAFAAEKAAEDA